MFLNSALNATELRINSKKGISSTTETALLMFVILVDSVQSSTHTLRTKLIESEQRLLI